MKSLFPSLLALVFTVTLHAQDAAEVTKLLKQLQSQDIETRQLAMFELQTSLDPRIPDACLPALSLEGDSIRRLAARAIGSRWHQIPKDRVAEFTAALRPHLKSEHDGLVNMARRGIALLNRDFKDPMLSRSKSKRWVIYERYGLPCLIDTSTMTEELLGPSGEAKMACAWGNTELAPTVKWNSKKDMVAIEIIEHRKFSTLWTWVHLKGVRKFAYEELVKVLGYKEDTIAGNAGLFTDASAWTGDNLDFDLFFSVLKGDDQVEHRAKLRWNSAADKLSLVSDKVLQ